MKYLIDTDWIIHALHGEKRVMRKLLELKGDGLAISIISVADLQNLWERKGEVKKRRKTNR